MFTIKFICTGKQLTKRENQIAAMAKAREAKRLKAEMLEQKRLKRIQADLEANRVYYARLAAMKRQMELAIPARY